MLRIVNVEELESLLLELPDLVQEQKRRSFAFAAKTEEWLNSLERAFASNRLYQAGRIASLQSELVSAAQGHVPAGLDLRGRPSRSRVVNALASRALHDAAEIASSVIADNRPRLAEAERIAQQVVAAALSRGLIASRQPSMSTTEYLQALRRAVATSSDLEGAVVHLEGLVGPYDALVMLDRALASHRDITVPPTPSSPFRG